MPRLDVVPWWVRVWYEIPLIDRYAHVWMWAHGGWEVRPPSPLPPGDQAAVREPRQPLLPEQPRGGATNAARGGPAGLREPFWNVLLVSCA
jgi:hypothetical protein